MICLPLAGWPVRTDEMTEEYNYYTLFEHPNRSVPETYFSFICHIFLILIIIATHETSNPSAINAVLAIEKSLINSNQGADTKN